MRVWRKIFESKQNVSEVDQVRYFKIPEFNINCNDYTTMIDLENIEVTTPLILDFVEVTENNVEELASKKLSELCSDIDLIHTPCHTQAVERSVKIVAEASAAVADENNRTGWILNTLKSRQNMSHFRSKKDFKPVNNSTARLSV